MNSAGVQVLGEIQAQETEAQKAYPTLSGPSNPTPGDSSPAPPRWWLWKESQQRPLPTAKTDSKGQQDVDTVHRSTRIPLTPPHPSNTGAALQAPTSLAIASPAVGIWTAITHPSSCSKDPYFSTMDRGGLEQWLAAAEAML